MLSSSTCRSTATGSDSTAVYNYGFRIFANTDLLVTVRNTTTNVETTLVLTTDYTVSGVGQASGSVTLVSAGQAWIDSSNGDLLSAYIIVIRRVRPLTQNVSIRNQSTFYGSVHEDEFDNLVMMVQQLQDVIARAVILPETVLPSVFNPILPAVNMASPTPGATPIVNAAGTGWDFAGVSGVRWQSVDLSYAAFQAAATTNQITAFSLPANAILMGVALKHTVAFAGTSITAVKMDLGISGTADLFLSQFDVLQSVSDTAFVNGFIQYPSWTSSTAIKINATSTGANLSALTSGTVRVLYWYMAL